MGENRWSLKKANKSPCPSPTCLHYAGLQDGIGGVMAFLGYQLDTCKLLKSKGLGYTCEGF